MKFIFIELMTISKTIKTFRDFVKKGNLFLFNTINLRKVCVQ